LAVKLATSTERNLPMSWKPEVIADSSGQWSSNAVRFATEAEAGAYVRDLYRRWTLVTKFRVIESEDPVNYRWEDGRLVAV
jgi:hypothetical protein